MPDYLNMPRQRGNSDNPTYARNPRKFARDRCDKAALACDKIIMYLGELIQIYKPEEMPPNEAVKHGIALSTYAIENGLDLGDLVDISVKAEMEIGELGKMAGYIAVAALVMRSAEEIRDTIANLKSSI